MKKAVILIFSLTAIYLAPAGIVYGAQGTPIFHVSKILVWGSEGMIKLYTDNVAINGLEGCTANDNSIAIVGTMNNKELLLSLALTAKSTGAEMNAWVMGCCVAHNGLESPCVNTLTLR